MDTTTIVIIAILIIAVIFLGITVLGNNSNTSGNSIKYSAPAYSGGGCGR